MARLRSLSDLRRGESLLSIVRLIYVKDGEFQVNHLGGNRRSGEALWKGINDKQISRRFKVSDIEALERVGIIEKAYQGNLLTTYRVKAPMGF